MEWDTRHQTQLPQEEKKRNNRFSNSANLLFKTQWFWSLHWYWIKEDLNFWGKLSGILLYISMPWTPVSKAHFQEASGDLGPDPQWYVGMKLWNHQQWREREERQTVGYSDPSALSKTGESKRAWKLCFLDPIPDWWGQGIFKMSVVHW